LAQAVCHTDEERGLVIVRLCLTFFVGCQRLAVAVTHGSVERWAAFAVGFLLTAAVLLVIF
jgi:hypothetical protein